MAMQLRHLYKTAVFSLLVVPALARAQAGGYPTGEAVEVYRAALDMLYTDGEDRPSVIVMLDTVQPRAIGPCPQCPGPWKHRSKIDTATIQAYAGPPYGIPPIRPFAYRIPIRFITHDDLRAMMRAGEAYDAAHPTVEEGPSETPMVGEFRRRFSGAWGWVQFTVVGLNPARTEALLGIHQHCGDFCSAREMVFFRKIGGKWTPVERVPASASVGRSLGSLRYRGPNVKDSTQSKVVSGRRPAARDDAGVYRTVLDSLYSFYGERPGMVVIVARRTAAPLGITESLRQLDSTIQIGYRFVTGNPAEIPLNLNIRVPAKFLSHASRQLLERQGQGVERAMGYNSDGEELTGFWRAFRATYPQAWGYVELSAVGYNPTRTRALVYSAHKCGERCLSSDAWLVTRKGNKWSIAERIRREELALWYLDSLRHLGRSAKPAWYKAGRARGVFRNVATGGVFPNQELVVHLNERPYRKVRTDARGRYSIELPRFGHVVLKTSCPSPHRDTLYVLDFAAKPAMDTTLNVELEPRKCRRLVRTHPWIAGDRPAKAPASTVSPQVAAVYRSVLDFLLPGNDSAPMLIQAYPRYICEHCLEREVPRLLKKGMIKLSTEADFIRAVKDSGPPPIFPYRRRITVFPAADQEFLRGPTDFWDVMKDAYPGVRSIVSFSKVGFDDQRAEALVEFRFERPGQPMTNPETMLLRRSGTAWNVALRHVTRPATSGEWSDGKCEPADAPAVGPRLSEIRTLGGSYMIVRVMASRAGRGSTDTAWVRLSTLKSPAPSQTQHTADVRVLDARGREQPKIQSTLQAWEGGARITFQERMPEGVIQTHGWFTLDEILRVDQTGFYGRWSSASGFTIPSVGHFCARKVVDQR